MHTKRIITGFLLGLLAIISIFFFPTMWFGLLCALVITLAAIEWVSLMGVKCRYAYITFVLAVWLCMWQAHQHIAIAQWIALIFWVIAFVLLICPLESLNWLKSKFLLLPMGLLILSTTWAAAVQIQAVNHLALFYLIMLVCFGDTAAYFVGVTWGKHRLAPSLSPKKSCEGLIGGLIVGTIAGMSMVFFMPDQTLHSYLLWVVFGLVLLIAAVLGDLFESLLKRLTNVKDSGSLLPGHGGILDRLDSLCATLPLFYIFSQLLHLV